MSYEMNRRYYEDEYGNEWMAYDSRPMPGVPSTRQRIMLRPWTMDFTDCDLEAGTVGNEGE